MSKSIPDWPAREPAGLLIKEPERLGTPDEQIAPEAAAGQNVRHSSTHRKTPGLSTGGVSGEELVNYSSAANPTIPAAPITTPAASARAYAMRRCVAACIRAT